MRRDQIGFLAGGLVFGFLIGYFVFDATQGRIRPAPAANPHVHQGAPARPGGASEAGMARMMEQINAMKERIDRDPEDHEALVRLANLFQDVGMFPQAVQFYKRAVELMPEDPNLLTDMGTCYRGMKEYGRALELFRMANRIDPDHWKSLYNVVVVTGIDLQRWDEAEEAMTRLEAVPEAAGPAAKLRQMLEQARQAS